MLKLEPGREEDAQFWLDSLSVNRAIMRALEVRDAGPAHPPGKPRGERRVCPRTRHQLQDERPGGSSGSRRY